MTGWVTIICVALGMAIYRTSIGNPGIIDSGIVGAISGAIGGILTTMYEKHFGKHHFSIVNFVDNIFWFILFCIPGAIAGVVLAAPFNVDLIYPFQTVILLFTMVIVSLILTMRKVKIKAKRRELEISKEDEI